VRAQRPPERKSDPDRWIISYADFVTLLFAVFTMLYAVSVVDAKRAQQLVHAIETSFRPAPIADVAPPSREDRAGDPLPQGPSLSSLRERLRQSTAELQLEDGIRVLDSDQGVVLRLADDFFFAEGGDALGPAAGPALERIASLLATTTNHLRIEGHSDDRPIATERFPSNWHLSAARAASIAVALAQAGVPGHRLAAAGLGAERPLVSNGTEEGRALNRRVEILVLRRTP
jgi:chemotaxis protein MotB